VGKLIKFEFLKKKTELTVIAIIMALVEIYALYEILSSKANGYPSAQISTLFFVIGMSVITLIFFIDLVNLLRSDLFKQEGYMLFMTPNSGYKILGSKIIYGLLEGLIFIFLFTGIFLFNLTVFGEGIGTLNVNFSGADMLPALRLVVGGVLKLIQLVLTIYFALTIYKSIFNTNRFGSMISFGLFLVINFIINRIDQYIASSLIENDTLMNYLTIQNSNQLMGEIGGYLNYTSLFSLIISVLLFWATGYLLSRKINL